MKRRNSTTDSVCTKGGSVIPFNYSFTLRHAKNAKCSSYDSMYVLNVTAKGWFYSSLENLAYNLETDQPPLRLWKAERPGCNLFNISKLKVQRESQHVFTRTATDNSVFPKDRTGVLGNQIILQVSEQLRSTWGIAVSWVSLSNAVCSLHWAVKTNCTCLLQHLIFMQSMPAFQPKIFPFIPEIWNTE